MGKGGPIEQSEKYKAMQQRRGLGYCRNYRQQINNLVQPTLSSSTAQVVNKHRVRLPPAIPSKNPLNVMPPSMRTLNARNNPVIILSYDDDESDCYIQINEQKTTTAKSRKRKKRKRSESDNELE